MTDEVLVSNRRHRYAIREEKSGGIVGVKDFTDNRIWRALVAECLGTFMLVLIGVGSCIDLGTGDAAGHVRIAFTFGITIATIVQAIGHISGGHINPAVTLSFFLTGDVKLLKAVSYMVVQCVGAIGGAALLKLIVPESRVGTFGVTAVNTNMSEVQGMVMEVALTFLLIFVIHGVCDGYRVDIKGSAPLAIGLAATASHFCGIQYTGSSINPARSFGPAVIMNVWENQWVYWVGPFIGAVLAALIYKFMFSVKVNKEESYDL